MTKSTITRERLEQLADNNTICKVSWDERIELAQIALAAMDSESGCLPLDYLQGNKDGLEWAAQLAEANHPETGDWLYDDPIELAKAIRKGPDMPPAQPAADSEPVAWTWQHLKQWYVTNDEERARDLAWDGVKVEPLYRHAQPAPVVPAEMYWQDAPVDGSTRAAAYASGWNACRAAMLQDGTLTNEGTSLQDNHSVDDTEKVNSPVIPDGYVMVPVEPNGDMLAAAQDAYGETDGDIASTLRAAMLSGGKS